MLREMTAKLRARDKLEKEGKIETGMPTPCLAMQISLD